MNKAIKMGDIYRLGEHLLACGDARDKQLISRLVGDVKIKCILTDVPYGIGYVESKAGFKQKLACEKIIANDQVQSEDVYIKFSREWMEAILPYLERKNSIYIFNSDRMIFALREAMLQAGIKFSQLIIWVKNHAVVGRLDYLPQHELIAYGWLGTHEFRKSQDKSVLFYPKPNKSKLHPTMKPVGLIRNLILNSTNIGDIIWDGFLGSGTTLIAAEQTKRKCYGVELDPDYCQIIIDRFEKLTKLKAKKLN